MKTLWISPSRLFPNNHRRKEKESAAFSSLAKILGRNETRFFSSQRQVGITFSSSIFMQQEKKRNEAVFLSSVSLPSATQETLPDELTQVKDTSKTDEQTQNQGISKKVRVKFQLQRKCSFGEQFLLLGDDTKLGSWDPLNAVPLDWSEGDIWTVELDIPIGKVIQYKFILKEINGDILWQPGTDRELQTWETMKIISVFENWESAGLQVILEEELVPKNREEFIVDSDLKIVAENITGAKNSVPIVAKNITDVVREPMNANNKANSEKGYIRANEKLVHGFKETKNEEIGVSYEGIPVLVPGLTPIANLGVEENSSSEITNHNVNDPSSQAEMLNEDSSQEEEEYVNRQAIKSDSTDERGQAYLEEIQTVFDNDVQWGRTTLRNILNCFGL